MTSSRMVVLNSHTVIVHVGVNPGD